MNIHYNSRDPNSLMDDESNHVPLRNSEGYLDHTAYKAISNVMQPEQRWRDPTDQRHWRLIKTLQNMIDLMGYDLLNRIELYDRQSGRTYR
jgi:hypothetical protein